MIGNETTPTRDQNDTETIGQRTAFNNEQSPYRIVTYKRPRNDNVKQFKRENLRPYLYKKLEKKMNENKYITHKQTITTELHVAGLNMLEGTKPST